MIRTVNQIDQGIKLPGCKINLYVAERLGYEPFGNIYAKKSDGDLYSKIFPNEFSIFKPIDPMINSNTDQWSVGKKFFSFGKEPKPFTEIMLTNEITNLSEVRISDIIIAIREYILDPEKMKFKLKRDEIAFEIDSKNEKILLYAL